MADSNVHFRFISRGVGRERPSKRPEIIADQCSEEMVGAGDLDGATRVNPDKHCVLAICIEYVNMGCSTRV